MLAIWAGTREARQLTRQCQAIGWPVLVLSSGEYGQQLAREDGARWALTVGENPLWPELLRDFPVRAVVDAGLPFPQPAAESLGCWCAQHDIPLVRLARPRATIPEDSLIYRVSGWEEAASQAVELGHTLFLTTGSYNLEFFLRVAAPRGNRVVARVIPDHRVVCHCQELGLSPRDLVAMQGPFSRQLNQAMFKAFGAQVVVTRESGAGAGLENKLAAARNLHLPAVVIERPPAAGVPHVYTVEAALIWVATHFNGGISNGDC